MGENLVGTRYSSVGILRDFTEFTGTIQDQDSAGCSKSISITLDPVLHCLTENHPTQHRYYRRQVTETTEHHVTVELLYQCRLCEVVRPWGLVTLMVSTLPVDLSGTLLHRPRGRPRKEKSEGK